MHLASSIWETRGCLIIKTNKMATRGVNACRLCHELFRTSLRRNFSIQSINNHSKISRLELFKIKERGLHITPAQWQVSNNLVRRNDKNFTWLKQMKMHCSSESSTLMEGKRVL